VLVCLRVRAKDLSAKVHVEVFLDITRLSQAYNLPRCGSMKQRNVYRETLLIIKECCAIISIAIDLYR
jgi:hypothetical protein